MAISTWQGQQEPSDSQAPGQHREEPQAKQVLLNKLQERGDQGVRALPLKWFFRIFLINASSSRVVAELAGGVVDWPEKIITWCRGTTDRPSVAPVSCRNVCPDGDTARGSDDLS